MEQRTLGVAELGSSMIWLMRAKVAEILLSDGAMVAGEFSKLRIKPNANIMRLGSRTHFFQLMIKPAPIRAWMRAFRSLIARGTEEAAPMASSTKIMVAP